MHVQRLVRRWCTALLLAITASSCADLSTTRPIAPTGPRLSGDCIEWMEGCPPVDEGLDPNLALEQPVYDENGGGDPLFPASITMSGSYMGHSFTTTGWKVGLLSNVYRGYFRSANGCSGWLVVDMTFDQALDLYFHHTFRTTVYTIESPSPECAQ